MESCQRGFLPHRAPTTTSNSVGPLGGKVADLSPGEGEKILKFGGEFIQGRGKAGGAGETIIGA